MKYRLYDYLPSGNGYKVRLVLRAARARLRARAARHQAGRHAHAGIPREEPERPHPAARDSRARASCPRATPSSAISRKGRRLVPAERLRARADVAVALLRAVQPRAEHRHGALLDRVAAQERSGARREARGKAAQRARRARGPREAGSLAATSWSATATRSPTSALYAYTHVAPEGGFALDDYPAIRAWCARVAAQPGYVPITSA